MSVSRFVEVAPWSSLTVKPQGAQVVVYHAEQRNGFVITTNVMRVHATAFARFAAALKSSGVAALHSASSWFEGSSQETLSAQRHANRVTVRLRSVGLSGPVHRFSHEYVFHIPNNVWSSLVSQMA